MLPCCIVHKGGSGSGTGIENENQATISNANATNTPTTTPSSMNTTSNVTSSTNAAVSEKTWNRRILEWAAHLISYRLFKVSLLVVG